MESERVCECERPGRVQDIKLLFQPILPSILYNKRNAIIKVTSIKHLFENYLGKV